MKNYVNIMNFEFTRSAYLVNFGTLLGTMLTPWSARGLWGALRVGAAGRRLGAQKNTKSVPRVLKDAKWKHFKNTEKEKRISPFGILRSVLRAPWAVQKASGASS